jgi:hypothetical protein
MVPPLRRKLEWSTLKLTTWVPPSDLHQHIFADEVRVLVIIHSLELSILRLLANSKQKSP